MLHKLAGILMMLVSGMHIAFGVLNFTISSQAWASGLSRLAVHVVISLWYFAVVCGLALGRCLVPRFEKKQIGVCSGLVDFFSERFSKYI
jgi:hypothetical protein